MTSCRLLKNLLVMGLILLGTRVLANEVYVAEAQYQPTSIFQASVLMSTVSTPYLQSGCAPLTCASPIELDTYWSYWGSNNTTIVRYELQGVGRVPSCPFEYRDASEHNDYAEILMNQWNMNYGSAIWNWSRLGYDSRIIRYSRTNGVRYKCMYGDESMFAVYFTNVRQLTGSVAGSYCGIGTNKLTFDFNLKDRSLDGVTAIDLLSYSCTHSGVKYSISLMPTQGADQIKLSENSYATVHVGDVRLSSAPTSIFLREGPGALNISVKLHGIADNNVLTGNSVIVLEPL